MPARAPKARGEMRPARPSAALRIEYQRRLERLIDEMHRSFVYWLTATYRDREDDIVIASDHSPARDLADQLRRRAKQWRKMFDEKAPPLARLFISKVDQHATNATKQAAVALTGMSVSVKDTLLTNTVMQATVEENVSLIKSISADYASEVEGLVMRSVAAGRDLKTLTDELEQRYQITRRRAKLIANDQNNKATAQMARARQLSLGVTKARWLHTGGGKHPRPEHVEANGKVFDLDKGLYIRGKWTFPGEDINCGCVAAPLIPGVDDEAE
jgi:SPP1 gp7 family putative phage head morphogenesis protein